MNLNCLIEVQLSWQPIRRYASCSAECTAQNRAQNAPFVHLLWSRPPASSVNRNLAAYLGSLSATPTSSNAFSHDFRLTPTLLFQPPSHPRRHRLPPATWRAPRDDLLSLSLSGPRVNNTRAGVLMQCHKWSRLNVASARDLCTKINT